MEKSTARPTQEWPGIFAALGNAFNLVVANIKPVISLGIVYALVATIGDLVEDDSLNVAQSAAPEQLVTLLTIVPVMIYALNLADGKRQEDPAMWLRIRPKRLLFSIVSGIIMAILIALSIVAFIIPAIWVIAWLLSSTFPIVDKMMGPLDALKESKRISQNHKGKIWALIFGALVAYIPYFIGTVFVAAIFSWLPYLATFVISFGAIFVTLWIAVTHAMLYRWLQAHATDKPAKVAASAE